MSMSDNTKKTRHIQHGQKMIFSKKMKHTCTWGGRWATNQKGHSTSIDIMLHIRKNNDTIRKYLIIKSIHVESLKLQLKQSDT